ncbi:DUF4352 domain-containing protein [Gordonia alkaliphila]|uniref:DUF4352 domain-containing protein n=1 Tax=Gordonia alkaliphila TaxID=1053547 RepID=UPI0027E35D5E|nr:DUF4352 domain-containing protein [Gordonia alkaliphila]
MKKSRKWLWIVLGVLVVIGIIIGATSGGETAEDSADSSSSTSENGNKSDDKGKTAGLNTPVRDGKFEFTVTGVESGLSEVGDNPYLTEQAQGQFVVVTLTVSNTGDKPQSFSPSEQKLKDSQGRTFESDSTAQIALGDTDIAVWDSINPGNSVDVKLVFDMPKDATAQSLELHDSMFSDGVTVNLTK